MESDLNPNSWNQYINPRDCSQGICSTICPQWCNNYINFSPPPLILNDVVSSNPNLSPLVIAIIGIFATAFLLVTYYTLVSKYCKNEINNEASSEIARSDLILDVISPENQDQDDPFAHESSNSGLDDALIKKIGFFKFKKHQNRLFKMNCTDCSICLGEFNQDDNLRLLPNCNHAFHVICIDRWLKSHSNCPLCRSKIVVPTAQELSHLNFERFSSNLRSIEENVIPFDLPQNVIVSINSHHPRRFSAADIAMPANGDEMGGREDERFDVENGNRGKIVDFKRSFSSGELFRGAQGTTRRSLNLTIPQ